MTQIENFRYEINEINEVLIWNDSAPNEDDAPFFLQPSFPDGTVWTAEQAEDWAVNFINQQLEV